LSELDFDPQRGLDAILARIDQRQKVLDLTDRALSLAAGLSADAVRSMRRGARNKKQRGISTTTITALAGPLKTMPEWLLTGGGSEELADARPATHITAIPVAGEVAAGVWVAGDAHLVDPPNLPFPVPPDPRFPTGAQYALVVRGSSFNRYAQDGDVLICVDFTRAGLKPRDGDLVIVSKLLADNSLREITARRINRMQTGDQLLDFHYESTDERFADHFDSQAPARKSRQRGRDGADDRQEIAVRALIAGVYRSLAFGR